MRRWTRMAFWVVATIVMLLLVGWLGLRVPPRPFSPVQSKADRLSVHAVPGSLPEPVERYARSVYGDQIPMITSAVISGRALLRLGGITFPARFRFVHQAGVAYRHYIEVTWFGIPVMRVNEYYLDAHARLELPFGVQEGPEVDQGARLALWAEAIWFPSVWLLHPDVRWQAVDDQTAVLLTPRSSGHDAFIVRFDPRDGRLTMLESMRYKAGHSHQTLWINEAGPVRVINGHRVPHTGAVTWMDEMRPWAVFTVESVVYNADVQAYLRQRGP